MSDERLDHFKTVVDRLWTMGRISDTANMYKLGVYDPTVLTEEDKRLLSGVTLLESNVGADIEKYVLSQAQDKAVTFLSQFEEFNAAIQGRDDAEHAVSVFNEAFKKYLMVLHPFAPFVTEALYKEVYKSPRLLAESATQVPNRKR